MDRGAWQSPMSKPMAVHRFAKSQTRLSNTHTHTPSTKSSSMMGKVSFKEFESITMEFNKIIIQMQIQIYNVTFLSFYISNCLTGFYFLTLIVCTITKHRCIRCDVA